jgi:hypothetical protein
MTDTDYSPLHQMVEAMLMTVDDYGPDADTLTIHFDALRAALATRPEPLYEGPAGGLRVPSKNPWTPFQWDDRVVVYLAEAVAGSATPTGDDE